MDAPRVQKAGEVPTGTKKNPIVLSALQKNQQKLEGLPEKVQVQRDSRRVTFAIDGSERKDLRHKEGKCNADRA